MSKEKEQTVDDICKSIDEKVIMTKEIAKEAAESIALKNKNARKDEMEKCLQKADYIRQYVLLVLRKARAEEAAAKVFLTHVTELDTELKDGKHDTTSYDKKFKEFREEKNEAYRKAASIFNEYVDKLNRNFKDCENFTYNWRCLVQSNY